MDLKKSINSLENLRDQIDIIDDKIIKLLVKRFSIVRLIGEYKKKHKLLIVQNTRTQFILNKAKSAAKINFYPPKLFEKIYTVIISASCEFQNKILKE